MSGFLYSTRIHLQKRCFSSPKSPFLARHLHQSTPSRSFIRPTPWLRQNGTEAPKVERIDLEEISFLKTVRKPRTWRQILFVTSLSLSGFLVAASQTNNETDYWKSKLVSLSPVWSVKAITNTDLKRVQNAELIQSLRETLANIQTTVQSLPVLIRPWINVACVAVMQPYADASEGKRLCWKICLLNAAVYAAWKVKPWYKFMQRSFMHHPLSGLSFTLLTSMFSHQSALHLLFNCLALESFGSAAYYYLLREQNKAEPELLESTSSYHFLSFYISAGLFAGLVSHFVTTKLHYPRLVAQLSSVVPTIPKTETWAHAVASATAAATTRNVANKAASSTVAAASTTVPPILPSLGASGAIYAAVTMTALAFPDSQVALFIPPSYPINIQYGVGGLIALDLVGIMRGWRFFDHRAHLGGAAFGVLYYYCGPHAWKQTRLDLEEARARNDVMDA